MYPYNGDPNSYPATITLPDNGDLLDADKITDDLRTLADRTAYEKRLFNIQHQEANGKHKDVVIDTSTSGGTALTVNSHSTPTSGTDVAIFRDAGVSKNLLKVNLAGVEVHPSIPTSTGRMFHQSDGGDTPALVIQKHASDGPSDLQFKVQAPDGSLLMGVSTLGAIGCYSVNVVADQRTVNIPGGAFRPVAFWTAGSVTYSVEEQDWLHGMALGFTNASGQSWGHSVRELKLRAGDILTLVTIRSTTADNTSNVKWTLWKKSKTSTTSGSSSQYGTEVLVVQRTAGSTGFADTDSGAVSVTIESGYVYIMTAFFYRAIELEHVELQYKRAIL